MITTVTHVLRETLCHNGQSVETSISADWHHAAMRRGELAYVFCLGSFLSDEESVNLT